MFYSHTFLARKGPLGTVWCAAHLQHKLKKSHYASTNIPSTVERIMYPEVPIALRLSGQLLLGVVRIYSKQVDYLYHDCNIALAGMSKSHSSVNINLPEDATHAPYNVITLGETFSLDALEIVDDYQYGYEDNHRKQVEDITLEDQIPTGTDPYIAIFLNEDVRKGSSDPGVALETHPALTEEDSHTSLLVDGTANLSPNYLAGGLEKNIEVGTSQDKPEPEIQRRATHDFDIGDSLTLPDKGYEAMEPVGALEELITKDKEAISPLPHSGEMLVSGRSSSPAHQPHVLSSIPSAHTHDLRSVGDNSPNLAVRSTTPAEQPRIRQRKRRRQLFDESSIVLTNEFMKRALENPSNLLRKKRNCPSTDLEIWKLDIRLKKDAIFQKPIINGQSSELQSICDPKSRDNTDIEIEHFRANEVPEVNHGGVHQPSSPPNMFNPSSIGGDKSTPPTMDSGQVETNIGSEVRPTMDLETPATYSGERFEDLDFLEQDDNTPAGLQGTPETTHKTGAHRETIEFDALSARTRAVAQYLRRQSSTTPKSDQSSGTLSLHSILEHKSRKICARMFFETLVLKNCGLVDIHQDEPYDDIKLQVTTKLAEEDS